MPRPRKDEGIEEQGGGTVEEATEPEVAHFTSRHGRLSITVVPDKPIYGPDGLYHGKTPDKVAQFVLQADKTGKYHTDDPEIIAALRAHPGYGRLFVEIK